MLVALLVLTVIYGQAAMACELAGGTSGDGTSAKHLVSEYEDNPLAWDDKYKGNNVVVSGKVTQIREWDNKIIILLDAGNPKYVEVQVVELYRRDVLEMKKGDTTTLRCIGSHGDSNLFTVVYLRECGVVVERDPGPDGSLVR